MRILVVNNFDSFVFNLVDYIRNLGAECDVVDYNKVDLKKLESYDGVLISPGPGTPEDAGNSINVVNQCAEIRKPLLGVCLGHQAIAVAQGGTVARATELLHGKTSVMVHDQQGVLDAIPSPLVVGRYHSLVIKEVPENYIVNGRTESGVIMAISHKSLPIFGLQFHPESVLTENGYQILGNWLVQCGDNQARNRSEGMSPVIKRG